MKATIKLNLNGNHEISVIADEEGNEIDPNAFDFAEKLFLELKTKFGPQPAVSTKQTPENSDAAPLCRYHDVEMRWVPGGISKKTNKPYRGFWACPEKDTNGDFCKYSPNRK